MTRYNVPSLNPFAEHSKLTRRIDAQSAELDRLELLRSAGHPIDEDGYAETQRAWEIASDERDALDDCLLASPIDDACHAVLTYRCDAIARIAERDPARGATEFRRLADHVAAASA